MRTSDSNKLRPIDAFVKYFLDVKPYHTKILEVVERYKFAETITVDITDTMFASAAYRNTPLCRPVGFGLIYDSCGFSNDSCCDLFQCLGGYGIIWDNSDLVATYPIKDIITEYDELIVNGNLTADLRLEIIRIDTDRVVLRGDKTAYFATQKLFLIAPFNVHQIDSISGNQVVLLGDVSTEMNYKKEFRISGTASANGLYGVSSALYDPNNEVTVITLAGDYNLGGSVWNGYVETETQPKNQGFYAVASVEYDGNQTTVIVSPNTPLKTPSYVNSGSVQLRTGLTSPRRIWLTTNGEIPVELEYRITDSWYEISTHTTHIITAEQLFVGEMYNNIKLYGYMTGAGFDGEEECDAPKPTNIHTLFGERLKISTTETPTPSA
jgi:hypothetical protein